MAAPTPEQLLSVAVQAAAAASEAAQALKDFASKSDGKQKFGEASKIIKQPDHFGSEDVDLDQRTWRDFLLNFKSWLFYADSKFESELKFVEEHPKVSIELSKLNGEEQSRALQLYSIFTGVLRGKPLRLLRQQEDRNGLEVYRELLQQFQPSSKSRALSLLSAYMQAPAFVQEKTLHEQVLGLERLRSEYQRCAGENVSDDLALSILVRCLPNHIRQHVQLQMSDSTTYDSIRSYVMSYEVVTSSWSTSKVHNELGVVGSYASPAANSGPSPMEIDAITWKGKGKHKGKDGKGKGKSKGKDGKGKGVSSWNSSFKGKGKDFSKGKSNYGKSNYGGKGSNQAGNQKLDPNQCAYCFKFGHRKADCRKMQSDKAAGNVRQINETDADNGGDGSTTYNGSSTGASSSNAPASQSNVQNIRAVSRVGPHVPLVQDLTAFEQYPCADSIFPSCIRVVQQHDMSCTDDDGFWTFSPFLQTSCDIQHICAIPSNNHGGRTVEILLDSGADSSVLPLDCANVGHALAVDQSSKFVDAQGAPIQQQGRRIAEVCLGSDVVIKEQFMVAAVTGGDEAGPDDRVVSAPTDGSVMVEGVKIDINCPLRVIRTACSTLGLSVRGSKKINMQRLQNFVKTQELMAAHSVETQLRSESKREVRVQKRPVEPTKEQIEKHNLTHEPFEEWCELCVSFRSRQDKHSSTDDSQSATSLISFDFGFCGRSAESTEKVTFLAMHDKDTGLIGAVPTLQKGGKHFQYLVSELTRFVVSTGHESVRLRCDGEPSTLSLLQAACKACRSLGIKVTPEPIAIGNHQANGGAERAVELIRSHANILITHVESCCDTGKQIFGCNHPLYAWALAHAAWLHNRFRVSFGQTAFERATGRCYTRRVAQFGERVFGFIRQERKGDPKWLPALWLGKTLSNDVHLLACDGVIFVSRSIRRVRDNFQLEMLGNLEVGPWDHGMASLGHRLFQSKRYAGPDPIPALNLEELGEQARPEVEVEEKPREEVGEGVSNAPSIPSAASLVKPPKSRAVSFREPPPDDPFRYGASKPPPEGVAAQAGIVENPGPNPALNAAPASPRGSASAERDAVELESSSRPSKQAKVDQPDQVMAVRDQHEDEELEFPFDDEEIDMLESYDNSIEDEGLDLQSSTFDSSEMEKLVFPFSANEPNLCELELQVLDDIADRVEIQRLVDMQVLVSFSEASSSDVGPKQLSTRFVRTWREKVVNDKPIWLRRSRLVAREYAWLSERTDLFSPASNALGGRLLQTLFLRMRSEGYILGAIDIGDAFLTVPQKEFTVVSLLSASGERTDYQLGRVLPGQRTGSQLWYEAITGLLCSELGMVQCPESPNLLRSANMDCYVLLHVDDMLICGKSDFVDHSLLPMLKKHHKVSSSFIRAEGDEISFLKRTHRLISNDMLTVSTHHKHVEQLMHLTGIKPTSRPKRVPGHPLLDEKDDTEALNVEEASQYRSCVGILLYLATDLPHCQHTIRWLSTGMATPTLRKKDVLRHLVSYLHGTKGLCLCLHFKGDNVGVHHQYFEEPDCLHLEVYSDSDWASNKSDRKSVSGGFICLGSCLMYSSSRTQKVISLSSGEAEVYAASSAACDSILLSKMVSFLTGAGVVVHHLLDSSAARGILSRQGVGRIRHLSCRVLWLQTLVKLRREFSCDQYGKKIHSTCHLVSAVSGHLNLADLGTKRLAKKRLLELMNFCNLGYVDNDIFTVCSSEELEHHQGLSLIRSIQRNPILRQLALASALSTGTLAMDPSCFGDSIPGERGWLSFEFFIKMFLLAVAFGVGAFLIYKNRNDASIITNEGDNTATPMDVDATGPDAVQSVDEYDVAMAGESLSERNRRYQNSSMSECSDPDFWQTLNYGGDTKVKFEKLHENVEVALLMTVEILVDNLNELGTGASWHCFHQLKMIYKGAVLQDKTQLAYDALLSLRGNLCGFLPAGILQQIYEPKTSYRDDYGELVRILTNRYVGEHDHEGEEHMKRLLVTFRDLNWSDLMDIQQLIDAGTERALIDMRITRNSATRVYEQRRQAALDNGNYDEVDALERNFEWLHYT